MHWLYHQELLDVADSSDCKEEASSELHNEATLTLVKAYVLADRLLAAPFRRAVNNSLVDTPLTKELSYHPDSLLPVISSAFENVPSDRPLLQRLVDIFCFHWEQSEDEDKDDCALNNFPRAFVLQALRRFSQVRREAKFADWQRCDLEHASEKQRLRCRLRHSKYDERKDCNVLIKVEEQGRK